MWSRVITHLSSRAHRAQKEKQNKKFFCTQRFLCVAYSSPGTSPLWGEGKMFVQTDVLEVFVTKLVPAADRVTALGLVRRYTLFFGLNNRLLFFSLCAYYTNHKGLSTPVRHLVKPIRCLGLVNLIAELQNAAGSFADC